MPCGGCRKNGQQEPNPTARGTSSAGDLSQFAYLSPKQLRLLKQQGKLPEDKK